MVICKLNSVENTQSSFFKFFRMNKSRSAGTLSVYFEGRKKNVADVNKNDDQSETSAQLVYRRIWIAHSNHNTPFKNHLSPQVVFKLHKIRTFSSAGQSNRLITDRPWVRIPECPLEHPEYLRVFIDNFRTARTAPAHTYFGQRIHCM